MKNKYILLLVLLNIWGCVSDTKTNEKDDHVIQKVDDDHGHEHDSKDNQDDHDENDLHLTRSQIKAIGLKFGAFSNVKISDFVSATGTLGLPPDAYASVSAKAEGFIVDNNRRYVEGSYVKKGAIIAQLENPDLIDKQQSLMEINAELIYLEQELARQKALFDANAGIERDVQKLQSEVSRKRAQKLGIEKYLSYIGINPSEVLQGIFKQKISIIASLSGYITSIEMHNGMFVKPEQQLLEIVSEDHLHLELDVFETDIAKVSKHQRITYVVPALGNEIYDGEVHVIGKEFDTDNKTVRIHGHLEGKRPKFIKDLFISAKIWLNDKTVFALPEEAVVLDAGASFIYVGKNDPDADEIVFTKIMVVPGASADGYISVKILDAFPDANMQVVTQGAYFVYARSKQGQKVHEH